MTRKFLIIPALVAAGIVFLAMPGATAALPGSDITIVFSCNVDGATVSIDGSSVGTIDGGQLEVPYEETYSGYTVSADNYYDKSGSIPEPMIGQTEIPISVTLNAKPAGSGKGWFTVHCNVNGASVAFNGVTKGTISGGVFTIEVATTGTPYTSFRVSKTGYEPYEDSISSMPADGQTIDLYATLNPVPTTTVTTAATPIGGDTGWFAIHCNVDGASVYFDDAYKGAIAGGVLTVPVYTTATPYSAYRVEKSGYQAATGSLPSSPAKGQTTDVYVTLNPVPTTTQAIIGGDKGYYAVHCNVDGVTVFFDATEMGVTADGVLIVQVATTGTPYTTVEVTKAGYMAYSSPITQYPAKDETVDIYATLSQAPTTAPTAVPETTETTFSPLPVPVVVAGLLAAIGIFGIRRTRN